MPDPTSIPVTVTDPILTIGEYIDDRVTQVMLALYEFISQRISEKDLQKLSRYATERGKRLRGVTVLLVAEALGGNVERAMTGAVAIELVHSSSLAVDDVMDGDETRRGQPATWKRFGQAAALMLPHVIVPHAALFTRRYGPMMLASVVSAWSENAIGQFLDSPRLDSPVAPADYLRINAMKTGTLWDIACELGARAADRSHLVGMARAYGSAIGLAFQIYDDAADLLECMGQPWGSLAKNGRALPVSLQALQMLVGDPNDLSPTSMIVEEAYTSTLELGRDYLGKAGAIAAAFPDSPYRALLLEFGPYCCQAQLEEAREKIAAAKTAQTDAQAAKSK